MSKERYFEYLKEKYWNYSARGKCEDMDESEGITLESLGTLKKYSTFAHSRLVKNSQSTTLLPLKVWFAPKQFDTLLLRVVGMPGSWGVAMV